MMFSVSSGLLARLVGGAIRRLTGRPSPCYTKIDTELRVEPASAIIAAMTALLRKLWLLALIFAVLSPWPQTAAAGRDRWRHDPAQSHLVPSIAADRRISLEQAIDSVQRATGGRVLDAKDLGSQYRIKVLTRRGEVRVVHVDTRTGAMRD